MAIGDIFPRRNLPNEAEQWGRVMEDRQVATEKFYSAVRQQNQSNNRAFASQMEVFPDRIAALDETATFFSTTRTVSPSTSTTALQSPLWVIPAPDWAVAAVVRSVSLYALTNSLSREVTVSAYTSNTPGGFYDLPNGRQNFYGDLTPEGWDSSWQGTESQSTYHVLVDGSLYGCVYYTSFGNAGTGNADLQVGVAVSWL